MAGISVTRANRFFSEIPNKLTRTGWYSYTLPIKDGANMQPLKTVAFVILPSIYVQECAREWQCAGMSAHMCGNECAHVRE